MKNSSLKIIYFKISHKNILVKQYFFGVYYNKKQKYRSDTKWHS